MSGGNLAAPSLQESHHRVQGAASWNYHHISHMGTVKEVTSFRPKNLPAIWAATSYTMEKCGLRSCSSLPISRGFPSASGASLARRAAGEIQGDAEVPGSKCTFHKQGTKTNIPLQIPTAAVRGDSHRRAKKPAAKEGRRWELETSSCFQEGSCLAEVGTQERRPSLPRGRATSRERKVMEVVKIQFRTLYQ